MKIPGNKFLFPALVIILCVVTLSGCLSRENTLPTVAPTVSATPLTVYPTTRQLSRTEIAATQTAFANDHVTGSIQINGQNLDTVGAAAGSTLDVVVSFKAASPFADVTEMRISDEGYGPFPVTDANGIITCGTNDLGNPWQPLLPSRTYPIGVPVNWSAFSIAVQYKDRLGNISPVYCDTLQIEGAWITP